MGNAFACMPRKEHRGAAAVSRSKRMGSTRPPRGGAAKLTPAEEELLHRQALAMAIHQHLDAGGSMSRRIDAGGGSMSRRIGPGSTSSRRHGNLPDSVTNAKAVRPRPFSVSAPLFLYFHAPLSQPCFVFLPRTTWSLSNDHSVCSFRAFHTRVQIVLENLETKKVVLVHGEGFGAWCWYKTISLLEEAGLDPVALDLTGSGIDHTDTNSITTLEEYSKPLIDYLSKLPENEKASTTSVSLHTFIKNQNRVVLVGHSCGGASVSYALEHCPKKISKAVFLTATMVKDSQRPFDVFSEELASADVFLQESQYLLYGNGKDKPPTGLRFDKQQIKGLYFNQSPSKVLRTNVTYIAMSIFCFSVDQVQLTSLHATLQDIALATVSMRPIPLAPIMEKLSLTAENYGSIRRYFIQTLDDRMLSPDVQEKLVRESPPDGIFKIKGGDHCPFFSKPQSLHKILLEILQIQAPAALFPGKAETLEEEEESAEKS
uniref:Uncharacterized protein n=1 Tax=Aegilops tauschii TaxID=37682 RepID=M8C1D2_AEGTA